MIKRNKEIGYFVNCKECSKQKCTQNLKTEKCFLENRKGKKRHLSFLPESLFLEEKKEKRF